VLPLVRQRLAALSPRLVLLFGSRARGDASWDSDYDLCVVADLPPDIISRYDHVRRLLRGIRAAFDVVVFTPAEWEAWKDEPASLAHRILREAKVLLAAA
jgi:predicted nucleotidyltransferase